MTDASIGAIAFVTLLTIVVGARGIRVARTPDDFMVAARQVPPGINAAAISGEYLSAASFLGIAGLIVSQGLGSLWYSVGYTAGYLVLLLLVAAPLRRLGAYTIPGLADAPLGRVPDPRLRRRPAGIQGPAPGGHRTRPGHRVVLPAAADEGRRHHAAVGARHALLGRRGRTRGRRERQHRDGRDEGHHVRPVLPVLAEAVRDRHSRAGAAGR